MYGGTQRIHGRYRAFMRTKTRLGKFYDPDPFAFHIVGRS